jgi:hypothetical protein
LACSSAAFGNCDGLKNFEWGNEIPRRTANFSSASASVTREEVIAECPKAARDGFEAAMKDYAMIGPSGMARTMLNYIGALASRPATAGTLEEKKPKTLFSRRLLMLSSQSGTDNR